MAEIAVTFLLEELATFLQNEVELLKGIPEDLEYIKDELQSMKAVLRVADSVEESNQEVKVWVQQVREVAYDTEDILDEYRLDLFNDQRHGIDACLYNVCCFTKNLKAQHRIASKIQGIKSRISNLSARRPNNSRGSRVLLTTRNSEVASTSCLESEDKVFHVEPLSPDESWKLFCKKCFRDKPCPPELEKHSRRILEKCEGLPLAIVAISGVLATKRRTVAEWETVYCSLGAEIEDNTKLVNFKEVLLLSFNDLPYHLKSCFLYLSLFPEYHLNELLNRSMIQVAGTANDGRVKTCRIHDLLV